MAVKEGRRKCRTCERRLPYEAFPIPKGKAKRGRLSVVCRECHAARLLKRERWQKIGRVCPRCEELRKCPEEISLANAPVCKSCQQEARSVHRRERRKHDPEVRRRDLEVTRRWRANNPEAAREAQRRYRAKIYSDQQKAEEWRDHNRIYHRLWRQRKGVNVRTLSLEQYRRTTERGRYLSAVPAQQLAATIERMIHWDDTEIVCERLGISSRSFREWQDARRSVIQFDVADRVLTRSGLFWWDVWDETNTDPAELVKVAQAFEGVAVAA